MHLGKMGTNHDDEEEIITFDWFGVTIRAGDFTELDFIDFAMKAGGVDITNVDAGLKILVPFLKKQIYPDHWEQFWNLALSRRQTLAELMEVSKAILEAKSGFPTGQQSVSSSGQTSTGQRLDPDMKLVMARLNGRPDLKAAVYRAQQNALDESVQLATS